MPVGEEICLQPGALLLGQLHVPVQPERIVNFTFCVTNVIEPLLSIRPTFLHGDSWPINLWQQENPIQLLQQQW